MGKWGTRCYYNAGKSLLLVEIVHVVVGGRGGNWKLYVWDIEELDVITTYRH